MVGRDAEIEVLGDSFEAAAGGTPRVVLLGGEAGGGKSRLVAEFTSRVENRALVMAGGCVDLGAAGLLYAPFAAMLRELVRQRGAAEVAGLLPGHGASELARLLPELGSPAADRDPEMARGRLFGSLLTLLEQLAGQRLLVLVVEDVHWAGRSTGELLAFLVRNLRHNPLLLVVTFRSDEVDDAPGLGRLLAELGRMDGVIRLELPRLSRGQVAAQLEGILGRPAEPTLASAVYQRGAGNPLFTEALLGTDGTVTPGLPWSLRELLLSRVKELPVQAQQVLRSAAVGGSRIGHGLLAAVTGLGDAALDDRPGTVRRPHAYPGGPPFRRGRHVRGEDVDVRWQRLGGIRPGNAQPVDPPPGLLGGGDHGLVLVQDDRPRLRGGVSVARARGAQVGPDPGGKQRCHGGGELNIVLAVVRA